MWKQKNKYTTLLLFVSLYVKSDISKLFLMSFHILNFMNDKLFQNIFCKNSYKLKMHHKAKFTQYHREIDISIIPWKIEYLPTLLEAVLF